MVLEIMFKDIKIIVNKNYNHVGKTNASYVL